MNNVDLLNIDTKKINLHFQRFEFKYLLPKATADILIPKLLKHMDWDPYVKNIPEKEYQVSSLYYDSHGLGCYYEKLAGVRDRKKLRLRVYDWPVKSDTKVYVEIKRKHDAIVLKDRAVVPAKDCYDAVIRGNYNLLKKERQADELNFINEFLWTKDYNSMTPKIMVIYKRRPLISKMDKKFRVTFDFDLHTYPADWLEPKEDAIPVCPDYVVMEVKYNNLLPFWFYDIIKDYQLDRIAFSKYCMSIEACQENNLLINFN